MKPVEVIVDSRIRLPSGALEKRALTALRTEFEHANPEFFKAKNLGFSTWGKDPKIKTWTLEPDGTLTLPRGGLARARRILADHEMHAVIRDRRVLRPEVVWPELKEINLRTYQSDSVAAALRNQQGVVRMPTGCISGDAMIGINRGGKSFRISLKALVERFNGAVIHKGAGYRTATRWDPEIPTMVRARGEDGFVRLVRLRAAWASGTKRVYRVRTADGHAVLATLDHRFMAESGWKPLREIRVGERVYVAAPPPRSKPKKKPWYNLVPGLRFHPYAGRKNVSKNSSGHSVPLHRLVVEASLNGLSLNALVAMTKTGDTNGVFFLDPKVWSVHHLDEDPRNNELNNLAIMSRGAHSQHHGRDGGWKRVTETTVLSEVEEISYEGRQPTYDLELDDPHNFIANGMVVHNSGKTLCALVLAGETRQPTLVIMNNKKLLEQWRDRAVSQLGIPEREIGLLHGGKKLKIGPRLTLALQQTLWSRSFPIEEVAPLFGAVMIDESQDSASGTYQRVVDRFPAFYRIGFSADERRADGKEFVIYDTVGEVIYDLTRKECEAQGAVVPVEARLFDTGFDARWYATADPGERDFNRLLDDMTTDAARNAVVVALVRHLIATGQTPILLFTHRVEHARLLADELLFAQGIRAGLLIGGDEYAVRYDEDKARLARGEIQIACGTLAAIGKGIDMPAVQSGILATPIAKNAQFFNQVRGRTCRPAAGKSDAALYVAWDRGIYPKLLKTVKGWNDGRAVEFDMPSD